MPRRRRISLGLVGALVSVGCRGEDISFDCEHQRASFLQAAAEEDVPLEAGSPSGPFQAALHLTEDGLNRLLEYSLGEAPFSGDVPFGILPQGPGTASFSSDSKPKIVFRPVEGCPTCVIYQIDFKVGLSSSGTPLSTGAGWAELAIPLEFHRDPLTGAAVVVANYDEVSIDDWYMAVFGFNSERDDSLSGAAQLFLLKEIRENYEPIELLVLDPWSLGAGVFLTAQQMLVDSTHQQLSFGWTSNLPLGTPGIDLSATPLPTPLGIRFETPLLEAMAHRFLSQEIVPRRYTEDGRADRGGDYGITLAQLAPTTPEQLDAELRIWRIANGYCGRAAVRLPLKLALDSAARRVALVPGSADLLVGHPDNQGAGVAAEEDASLVDEHRELLSTFAEALGDELAKSLGYPEFQVPETRLLYTLQAVTMTSTSLDLAIDFGVYAAPGP